MADALIHPPASRRVRLGGWSEALANQRAKQTATMDAVVSGWASVLLVATMLYLLIGAEPYQHGSLVDPATGGAVTSPVYRYIWLTLLGVALPILWWRRAELATAARKIWPLLVLLTWFAATTCWALDPDASRRRLILYGVELLICLAVSLGLRDGRKIHRAVAIACAIVIVIDLVGWVVAPAASMTDLGLAGIHNHKNSLGAAMMFSGLVCTSYAAGRPSWSGRLFWMAVTFAGVVLLGASLSKTSLGILVATAMVAPLLLAVLRARADVLLGLALGLSAMLTAAAVLWLGWNAAEGLDPLAAVRQITFTQRTEVWKFVLDQFAQHPWRGVGFASFWDIDPRVQPSLQTDYWFAQPDSPTNESHNGYIDLLVTTGVPGLIGSLLVLLRWVWRGLSLLRAGLIGAPQPPGAVAYLAYLAIFPLLFVTHNFMESSYFNAGVPFAVVILLVGVDIDIRFARGAAPARRRAMPRGVARAAI